MRFISKHIVPLIFLFLLESMLRLDSWYRLNSLSIIKPAMLSFGTTVFLSLVVTIYLLKKEPHMFKLRLNIKGFLLGLGLFVLLWGRTYWFSQMSPPASSNGQSAFATLFNSRSNPMAYGLWVANLTFLGPVLEELLFRGLLMTHYFKKSRYYLDVLFSAILFSLFHFIGYPWDWLLFFSHFSGAIVYALFFRISQSIWPSVFLHSSWNSSIYFLTTLM